MADSVTPPRPAQTNLQLYGQLLAQGWDEQQLLDIQRAYDLAASRFAGTLRATGKCFLAHLVGTASITATFGGDARLTQVALLHAWRIRGHRVFGARIPGLRPRFPSALTGEIADGIARYENLHRRCQAGHFGAQDVAALGADDRATLLVHLANETEEFLDRGMCYCESQKAEPNYVAELVAMACRLEQPGLATLLQDLVEESRRASVPARLNRGRTKSYRP